MSISARAWLLVREQADRAGRVRSRRRPRSRLRARLLGPGGGAIRSGPRRGADDGTLAARRAGGHRSDDRPGRSPCRRRRRSSAPPWPRCGRARPRRRARRPGRVAGAGGRLSRRALRRRRRRIARSGCGAHGPWPMPPSHPVSAGAGGRRRWRTSSSSARRCPSTSAPRSSSSRSRRIRQAPIVTRAIDADCRREPAGARGRTRWRRGCCSRPRRLGDRRFVERACRSGGDQRAARGRALDVELDGADAARTPRRRLRSRRGGDRVRRDRRRRGGRRRRRAAFARVVVARSPHRRPRPRRSRGAADSDGPREAQRWPAVFVDAPRRGAARLARRRRRAAGTGPRFAREARRRSREKTACTRSTGRRRSSRPPSLPARTSISRWRCS